MILALVFSKDRALQLEATLSSFLLQASDADLVHVVVLYRATSARHAAQYDQLARRLGRHVRFVPEVSFRGQVLEILKTPAQSREGSPKNLEQERASDYGLFLVDDNIFLRPFRLSEAGQALDENQDTLGFSLRLGRNTTYCYSLHRPQPLPRFEPLERGVLKFAWSRAEGDFGYPLEISSSLYRLQTILGVINEVGFESPSSLESQMATHARDFSRRQPSLLCYEQSVAFSTPLNRVQDVYPNRAGDAPQFMIERLADLFDGGKRIDLRPFMAFVPNACHQEVELQFQERDDNDQPK